VPKILFLGQKPVGEKCFQALLDHEGETLEVCAVCSNTSTNNWWGTANIYHKATMQDMQFISNDGFPKQAIKDIILKHNIDTIISVQHPHIITPDVLEAIKYNAYGLHLAKLPEYKGYNAANFAILNGDRYFFATIHKIADVVDSGNIVAEQSFPVDNNDTALSLYKKSEEVAIVMFEQFVEHTLFLGQLEGRQQKGKSCYHKHGSLDAVREIKDISDPTEIDRKARALYFPPFEPAYFKIGEKKYYVLPQWEK